MNNSPDGDLGLSRLEAHCLSAGAVGRDRGNRDRAGTLTYGLENKCRNATSSSESFAHFRAREAYGAHPGCIVDIVEKRRVLAELLHISSGDDLFQLNHLRIEGYVEGHIPDFGV